jgi:hypothetical protein
VRRLAVIIPSQHMKQLTLKIILPITIISFASITKWWYALVIDAPHTMFTGFPLPFVCKGWHTSMSLQIFLLEFALDFLTYFLFWFLAVYLWNGFLSTINPHKILTASLWVIAGIVLVGANFLASNSNNLFYLNRPFDMNILATGYKFVWQDTPEPAYEQYHPKD